MNIYSKFFLVIISVFFSSAVLAKNITLLNEIRKDDGSAWVIEKVDENYNLKYTNAKGKMYSNNTIITSDIDEGNLFLDAAPDGSVSLVMDYPKDFYIVKFSSGSDPNLLSACKIITLPSADKKQAVALLTLCSKGNVIEGVTLSNADADKLLASDNLILEGGVKTVIGNDKSFLYDEKKKKKKNKPYLIKGDVVEVQEYKNSMLKIKYISKSKAIVAWINFVDIL